jgi:hypothetical protein
MLNFFKKKGSEYNKSDMKIGPEYNEGDMKIEPDTHVGKTYYSIYIYTSGRWFFHDIASSLEEAEGVVSHMLKTPIIYKKKDNTNE